MEQREIPRREREKLRRRREMLASALVLFGEKGYHNVSMLEIAKRAEFAIGTLYSFFRNKEDLYKTLIMEKVSEYHDTLKEILTKPEKRNDVPAAIRGYVSAKAEIFAENVATWRLYFGETRGASFNIKAGLDEDIRKQYDDLLKDLATVLERGVRKKVLRNLDPYYMAVALEGLSNAFLLRWMEDPERHPYETNVEMITDLFLRGSVAR
ncbi:MAG: TetR/AcrR family transcriptional regulator [Candidatus Eisenbacteria sp.]|nr:TetR/AcrR family transcriptional regulator [Candidatus Eisenbacteria bacterium]